MSLTLSQFGIDRLDAQKRVELIGLIAAEAIGYFDALRPGLGKAFLIHVQDVLLRIQVCPRFMASSGGTCVRRDYGGSPMSSITVSTKIVWRCWRASSACSKHASVQVGSWDRRSPWGTASLS